MPRKRASRTRVSARTRNPGAAPHEYLLGFGFFEAEVQKLTPLAAHTLRNMLEVMNFQEEGRRTLVRDALSALLGTAQQGADVQELAMAILNAESRFPEAVRADLLQLASRLHRFA